jgi:hypothetical protein
MKPDPEMVIKELPATGAVFGETEVHTAKKVSGRRFGIKRSPRLICNCAGPASWGHNEKLQMIVDDETETLVDLSARPCAVVMAQEYND